jgi:hypothetical protein
MAAYKTLNSQDIIVSPLELVKSFSYSGSDLIEPNVGIDRYLGSKLATDLSTGYITPVSQSAIYFSAQQLYYSNYISSSNGDVQVANTQSITPDGVTNGLIPSNAYFNFEQTDLNSLKFWPTGSEHIGVMSIPKAMFGDYIQPNSIIIDTPSGSYYDDGEGRLRMVVDSERSIVIGNVIYEHGMIIYTGGTRKEGTGQDAVYGSAIYGTSVYGGIPIDDDFIDNFVETTNITMSFSSSFTIYETQYKCTIGESEFNYTLNPTVISNTSNNGTVYDYVTGSYFSPYVTTVGLYNNDNELMAVGKLAQPLPTSRTTDTTILVNIDRQ